MELYIVIHATIVIYHPLITQRFVTGLNYIQTGGDLVGYNYFLTKQVTGFCVVLKPPFSTPICKFKLVFTCVLFGYGLAS